MFLEYFTTETGRTETGGKVGLEVETDFVGDRGEPITARTTKALLALSPPVDCQLKLELGRQKLELAVAPQPTAERAIERTLEALDWLYQAAARFGARPVFAPELNASGELLWVQEERDEVWVQLDGRSALEQLCRCSSVQFTIDVNPAAATGLINRLWRQRLHQRDYEPNHQRWLAYIESSRAGYTADRYGGPEGFESLGDYCRRLESHPVVMHRGQPCHLQIGQVDDLNRDLFLRSVWWHYRLRRYGQSLALEIRPLARRTDDDITLAWGAVKAALGF